MKARDYKAAINQFDIKGIDFKTVISLMRVSIFLLFLFICFIFIGYYNKNFNGDNYRDNLIANFRFDINKLCEATGAVEIKRMNNKSDGINSYGSDGKVLVLAEIKPSLRSALVKIGDSNKDGKISNEEISALKIMSLEPDIINKELSKLQYHLDSPDHNLRNYVVVTQGENAGIVLYNGYLKFVDSKNKRYFGIELFR